MIRLRLLLTLFIILFLSPVVSADTVAPVTGESFDSLLAGQQVEWQRRLEAVYPESEGYSVTGPLDPLIKEPPGEWPVFSSLRVICPSLRTSGSAYRKANALAWRGQIVTREESVRLTGIAGYEGSFIDIVYRGKAGPTVQLLTVQQLRFLIWTHRVLTEGRHNADSLTREDYGLKVSVYLQKIDSDNTDAKPPQATDFGLPESIDLYAPDPPYVIQGYQNYKEFLHRHSELTTDFAHGFQAFVPTNETLEWLKENAPREAYPNKEAAKLQEEYQEFFERGGDVRSMKTLTKEGFDTLRTGEYFFAVGPTGKIRFGREQLREEVRRIERETGQKAPRANHAFLFPGEPVLTAGAFFIDERAPNKLVKVNAQSGHYFYSNIQGTIREDIAERSNHYLLTLGHFFKSLDSLGIPYEGVLISKF